MIQVDHNILQINKNITQDALYAATWGTVGAILRGLWFLKDVVTDRQYRNSFRIYFLTVPFLGSSFWFNIIFYIINGFLYYITISITNYFKPDSAFSKFTSSKHNRRTISSHLAIIPLATLAGFNWEWAIMIFKRIGDSFKEVAEPKSKIGK